MSDEPLLHVIRDVDGLPGQWRYTVPQTGVLLTDSWWSGLRDKVYAHLRANGIEVDDELALVIEDAVCRETRPGSKCAPRKAKPIAGRHPLPMLMYVNSFLRAVWGALRERRFVPREEAERRAEICRACEFRVESPGGCTGCYTLLKKANELMDKNPIKFEPDEDGTVRDTCQACLCVCHLKVWLTDSVLDASEGAIKPKFHEKCWRLEKRG